MEHEQRPAVPWVSPNARATGWSPGSGTSIHRRATDRFEAADVWPDEPYAAEPHAWQADPWSAGSPAPVADPWSAHPPPPIAPAGAPPSVGTAAAHTRADPAADPAPSRDYRSALGWAAAWLAIPLLLAVLRTVMLSGGVDDCAATGLARCSSPRADALADLVGSAPLWLATVTGTALLALLLRWTHEGWRSITIGLCSAVVAGGAVTLLASIV